MLEIAFLSSDNETPVFLTAYGYPVIINSYTSTAPPDSKFIIPVDCAMAKSAKTKNKKAKRKSFFKKGRHIIY